MKDKEKKKDYDIIRSIAGEGQGFISTHIEPDYFERERRENNIASGMPEEMPELVKTDIETIIRRSDILVSELEHKRCPRYTEEYPEIEEDDKPAWFPSITYIRL